MLVVAIGVVSFAAQATPTKHPLAQMVAWEIQANAELKEPELRRMVQVILERGLLGDTVKVIGERARMYAGASLDVKQNILSQLSLEELKQLAVLPANLMYFDLSEAQLNRMGELSTHELNTAGLDQAQHLLKFTRDGIKYVRWAVHPFIDASQSKIAKIFEKTFGTAAVPHWGYLKFHFTASRSVIAFHEDDYSDAISIKLSLPEGQGPFKNKEIHLKEWRAWIRHNQWALRTLTGHSMNELVLQLEPLGYGVTNFSSGLEDAFLARRLGDVGSGEKYYLPAFAALDEEVGKEIARLNGSADPFAFWEKNLIEPFARATSRLRAFTGMQHTSPHSQNVMIELDRDFKVTGRIVLRDFDFYIDRPVFETLNKFALNGTGLMADWWGLDYQNVVFQLRNGLSTLPSWLSEEGYQHWLKSYFSTYKENFSAITGIPEGYAFKEPYFKYSYYNWAQVEGDDFIRGESANMHSIAFAGTDYFSRQYLGWLNRGAQEARPSNVQVQPSAQIVPMEDFSYDLQTLTDRMTTMTNYDGLKGHLKNTLAQAQALSLKQRKEIVQRIGSYVVSCFNRTTNVSAREEVLELFQAIDPAWPNSIFNEHDLSSASPKIASIFRAAKEINALIAKIRGGSRNEAVWAIANLPAQADRAFPTTADGLAYRLKRETDVMTREVLVRKLAQYAVNDGQVWDFLVKNPDLIPDSIRNEIQTLLKSDCNTLATGA